ncbi:unnamed protein product [Diabrotica balteata]|uniref:NTF2 domain-containing protein n=1 Tax=Diabrotica balteata TaxID=107213 RepID=A0A9N9XAW6_DIABA|nr:unnamed protein product [Diabrotica balteata]
MGRSKNHSKGSSSSQKTGSGLSHFTLMASIMTESLVQKLIREIQDHSYYHKFIITNISKDHASRRNILKSIMDVVKIDTFQPLNFYASSQSCSFIATSCLDVIMKIISHRFKIPDCSDRTRCFEFTILVNFVEVKKQQVRRFDGHHLWSVIDKRRTNYTVNLDNFCEESGLDHFYLLEDNRTLFIILQYIAKWNPNEVILSNNYISDLTHFVLLSESVTYLDLNNNLIKDVESLQILSLFRGLKTLDLRGNPVCTRFADAWKYRYEILRICPNLRILDGAPAYENSNLQYKKNFVCSEGAEDLASVFLEHFFTLYDSPDRSGLIPLYNSHALFSVTATIIPNQENSNSVDLRHYGLNSPYAVSKMTDIIKLFAEFPRSYHDPYPMVCDVVLFTRNTACLTVCGIFRELNQVLSFTRSFFFWRIGDLFRITNEQLHVSNATDFQMGWSFAFPVDVKYFGNPLPYYFEQYDRLEQVVCKITKMNVIYARKYLDIILSSYGKLETEVEDQVNRANKAAAFEVVLLWVQLGKMSLNKYLRQKVLEKNSLTVKTTWMTLNKERIKSSNDALPETNSTIEKLYRTSKSTKSTSKTKASKVQSNIIEVTVFPRCVTQKSLNKMAPRHTQKEPSFIMSAPSKEAVKDAPSISRDAPSTSRDAPSTSRDAPSTSRDAIAKVDPLLHLANRMAKDKELALKAIEDLKAKEKSANPVVSNPMVGSTSNLKQRSKEGLQDSISRGNSASSSKQLGSESTSRQSDQKGKLGNEVTSGKYNRRDEQKPSTSVTPVVKGTINNDMIQKIKENIQKEKACTEKLKSMTFEKEKRIAFFENKNKVFTDEFRNYFTEDRDGDPIDVELILSSTDTEVGQSEEPKGKKFRTRKKRKSKAARARARRKLEEQGVSAKVGKKTKKVKKSFRYFNKKIPEDSLTAGFKDSPAVTEKESNPANVKQSQLDDVKQSQLDDVKQSQLDDVKQSQLDDVKQSQLDDVKKQSQITNLKESHVLSEPPNTGKLGSTAEKEEKVQQLEVASASKENLDTETNSSTSQTVEVSGELKRSVEDAEDPAVKKLKLTTDTTTGHNLENVKTEIVPEKIETATEEKIEQTGQNLENVKTEIVPEQIETATEEKMEQTGESQIGNAFKRPRPKLKTKQLSSIKRKQKVDFKQAKCFIPDFKRQLVVILHRMTIEEIKAMVPHQNLPSHFIEFTEEKKAQDVIPKPTEKAEPTVEMKPLKILLSKISVDDIKEASSRASSQPTEEDNMTDNITTSTINPVESNPPTSFQIVKQETTSITKTDDAEQNLIELAPPQIKKETEIETVSAIHPIESDLPTAVSQEETTSNTKSHQVEQNRLSPALRSRGKKGKNKLNVKSSPAKHLLPKTSVQPTEMTDRDVTSIFNPVENKLHSKFKIPKLSEKIADLNSGKTAKGKKNKESRSVLQNYSEDDLSYEKRNVQRITANKAKQNEDGCCSATSSERQMLDNEEIRSIKNDVKHEDKKLLKKTNKKTQMKISTPDSKIKKLIKEEVDTVEIEDIKSTNFDQIKTQNIKLNLISKFKTSPKQQIHESDEEIIAIAEVNSDTTSVTDGLGTNITVKDEKSQNIFESSKTPEIQTEKALPTEASKDSTSAADKSDEEDTKEISFLNMEVNASSDEDDGDILSFLKD